MKSPGRNKLINAYRYNPHDDVEPFLREILKPGHGKLAPTLHRLVQLLRDTLPIAVLLDEIRLEAEKQAQGPVLDIYPKSVAWYRISYNGSRYEPVYPFPY